MNFDLSGLKYEPPCEPVKPLVYVIDTDEVISGYESKYRQGEKQFNNYKQLNDKTSLEWFCSDELINFYESCDCKNLRKYKPSKAEIDLAKSGIKEIKNLPTNALLKASKEAMNLHKNSTYQRTMDAFKNSPFEKIKHMMENTPMERLKRAMENTPAGMIRKLEEEAEQQRKFINPDRLSSLQSQLNDPLSDLRAAQTLHNSLITPEYISTAETALKALGGHSALRDKIASIKPYQSELDNILSRGIDVQAARAMYGTHSELLEQFRNLKPPKKLKKNIKFYKQETQELRKTLKAKDKTHAKELRKQDKAHAKKIEKRTTKLEKENRSLLLVMANNTGQNLAPKTEPNWAAGRPKDTEPANFITIALKTYWHSEKSDGKKREVIPDLVDLRSWLLASKEGFENIEVINSYFIKINTDGYWIDNTYTEPKTIKHKSFNASFDKVLLRISENLDNQ